MDDGCYLVNYTPTIAGKLQIDVNINGNPVEGAPFRVLVEPTVFVPLHFTHSSADVVEILADGMHATWQLEDQGAALLGEIVLYEGRAGGRYG